MITVQPSTSFEAVAKFPTGLTGTLGVRITDNAGATTLARQTTGIAEYPAGSGIYEVTLTSPGTAGQYSLVWDDEAGHFAQDDLLVTTETTSATIGSGHLYVTRDDLKDILGIKSTDYADTLIDVAVEGASRAIEGYKGGQRFYPTSETRVYTATFGDRWLDIDDLISATSVKVDNDGDGTYETTWVEGTDFVFDPPNSQLQGQPKRRLVLLTTGGFTSYEMGAWRWEPTRQLFPLYPRAIQIIGTFGWTETPGPVKQAAVLLANRFLARVRSAPLGMAVASTGEAVAMARLGRLDPDVAFLLDSLPGGQNRLFV